MKRWMVTALSAFAVGACVGAQPAPSHPMSESGISENERAARQHELDAAEHRRAARPQVIAPCPPAAACWAAITDPAAASEYEQAEKQERLAADHRSRVKELREAEQRACSTVTDYDRSVSPFAHLRDIQGVEPLTKDNGSLRGIVVTFKNVRGLTVPALQQIVECHLARNAALGHDVPEMVNCPLVPRVKATVLKSDAGITVKILAEDDAAAAALQRCSGAITAVVGPAT